MSTLTKTQIITEVKRRTGRGSADVTNAEVEAALEFFTLNLPALYKECTTTTVIGQPYYDLRSFPKLFQQMTAIKIENPDNALDNDILGKIDSFAHYQWLVADNQESDYDQPDRHLIYNDYLYVYPTPDKAYPLTIFTRVYEDDADNISLPYSYREPVYELTCYEVYKNKGLAKSTQAMAHMESFGRWLNAFTKLEADKTDVNNVQFTDI